MPEGRAGDLANVLLVTNHGEAASFSCPKVPFPFNRKTLASTGGIALGPSQEENMVRGKGGFPEHSRKPGPGREG